MGNPNGIVALCAVLTSAGWLGAQDSRRASFELEEATIVEMQAAMEAGTITSVDLVERYLARIHAYDQQGPSLNAMIFLNPKALQEAAALDAERAERGARGPLHGVPIVVKDNYDTFDMPTTDGSRSLEGLVPPDDAFQVHKLRQAGAVIIGKTNLHEFARGITTISSLGGQTLNPYDTSRNPGGSSGGTGAAVAANFAAVGMGSDTCGSIRIPSSHNCLVGLRVTRGLSSRDGIIPLSSTQDVAGPLARTVEDLAIVLDATVGYDPADPITALGVGRVPTTYRDSLRADGLQGARIGLLTDLFGSGEESEEMNGIIRAAAESMAGCGAEVVELSIPGLRELLRGSSLIDLEFKFDLDRYLEGTPGAPLHSLEAIVESGLVHPALDGVLRRSLRHESLDTPEYKDRLLKREQIRLAALIAMADRNLDALLYPTMTREPAPVGQGQRGSNCSLSATSGLPAISVPAGFTAGGLPAGVELLGRPFAEPDLIRFAYAYEQATRHRRPPQLN
jgi:Asp-tRNA(Asn)/Glu-tRNA(Gln) amidotransferase A subunit family amidase